MRLLRVGLIVTGVMALLHTYIGMRLIPDLPISDSARILAVFVLVLSCVLVPLGLLARFIWRQPLADRLTWAGTLTMGWFSSLLMLTVVRDIALEVSRFLPPLSTSASGAAISAIAVPAFATLASLIGFAGARRRPRIVDVDVPLRDLPAGLHGFTIVQVSDIHVGPTIKAGYVSAVVDAVNALHPDLIAVTGDLVDGTVAELAPHVAPMARLTARYGSYFVTGNHEYYSGAAAWKDEVRRLGLRVLENEHVVLHHQGAVLVLAGVPDFSAHRSDPRQRSDPREALAGAPANAGAKVLLAHQPRSAAAAESAGFDLQLSGHTHGGQFWPWNLLVRLQQPYTAGLHRVKHLWVYTSRGTGYWGPPQRFGAPSEITRLCLVPAIG
ncbi:Metallophosphoesterase [Burkholderiales bacterium]|nr:Metallophosphoesterase [Burkholderiales bacterium]